MNQIFNDIDIFHLSEEEVIKELQNFGIQVIYKPMALLPDNLESYHGIGREPLGNVCMDIYDALNKIKRRRKLNYDPFS